MQEQKATKLVLGFTSPGSTPLIRGQVDFFVKKGFQVYLMCPYSEDVKKFCANEGCIHVAIPIKRTLSFFSDIRSLFLICKFLMAARPDIINVGTPKMGALGMLASFLCRIPVRIYTARGLAYQLRGGLYAQILKIMERFSGRLAHKIICVGSALMNKAVEDRVYRKEKCVVIGKGGSNGVDLSRFDRAVLVPEEIVRTRRELDLEGAFVFGFVGRMVNRKGVDELFEAFDRISKKYTSAKLLWVGTIELNQLSNKELPSRVQAHPSIVYLGWQNNIPLMMSMMDVFVIPSWWEGFGNVHIQAAAMGLPVVTTKGVGCIDAVSNGFNGITINIGNAEELYVAMENYLTSETLRSTHGKNSIEWSKGFDSPIIWNGLLKLYSELRKA